MTSSKAETNKIVFHGSFSCVLGLGFLDDQEAKPKG
jgi:hypothetical protein